MPWPWGEAVGAPTPPFTVLSEEDAPRVDLTDPDAKEVPKVVLQQPKMWIHFSLKGTVLLFFCSYPPPWKLRCPLKIDAWKMFCFFLNIDGWMNVCWKRDRFERKWIIDSNHQCSGDMFVFSGVKNDPKKNWLVMPKCWFVEGLVKYIYILYTEMYHCNFIFTLYTYVTVTLYWDHQWHQFTQTNTTSLISHWGVRVWWGNFGPMMVMIYPETLNNQF